MNLPDDPRGRELQLLIERAKYERWLLGETQSLIEREFDRVVDVILSPQFRSLSQFEQQRKLQLFRELERQIHAGYAGVTDFHVREMRGYADFESEVARAQVSSMLTGTPAQFQIGTGAFLPRHTIQSIAALPIDGLKIGEWFDAQARTMSLETRRIIQNGLIEGKGTAEISRRLVADARTTTPFLSRRAVSEARSVARTTVNAVQNHAAQQSYESLPESISDSYQLHAIRDGRTTVICIALDGKIYRYDDPKKRVPPFHVGCRTSVSPLVKGADMSIIEQKKQPHTWASYSDWLRAQSKSQQDAILGPSRGELWRSGKVTLPDLIDDDNRVLTLAQLRNRFGIGVGAGR